MKSNLNSFYMVTTWRLQAGVMNTYITASNFIYIWRPWPSSLDRSNIVSVGGSLRVTWRIPHVGLYRLQGHYNGQHQLWGHQLSLQKWWHTQLQWQLQYNWLDYLHRVYKRWQPVITGIQKVKTPSFNGKNINYIDSTSDI